MAKVETFVDLFTAECIQRIVKRFAENDGYEKCHAVLLKVQKCINKGEDAVKQMELLVKEINSLHKVMAITKAGGTVASIGGGVGAVGGILFGAATGGFGALLVAGIVGGGGLLTGLSATTASSVIENTNVEQKRKLVNRYLNKYADAVQELKESWKHLEQLCEEISILEDTSTMSLLLLILSNFTQVRYSLSTLDTSELAWGVLAQLTNFIPSATTYLVYQISDSYDILFKGKTHTIVQQVEDILFNLRRQINQLKITRNELAKASQK